MNPTRYLLTLQRALLVFLWTPTIVLAATASQSQLLAVDGVLFWASCVLATMMAITVLFIRLNTQFAKDPTRPLVRPWMFAGAHMGGSWMAGAVAFVIGQAQQVSPWYILLGVLLASFLGARFLEAAAERYLPVVRPPKETA